MKNFGASRVIEPKGSLPVSAWRIDNERKLRSKEIRIAIDYITVERDSMCQLCSICEHEDEKIKEKLLKFVSQRGKLHNPYTDSGAIFSGTVEELAEDYPSGDIKLGDYVICLSTMTGIPVYIEEIEEIDYDFAQIKCKGYAICFETTILERCNDIKEERRKYLRRAIDEEGTFYGISRMTRDMDVKRVLIIGNSLIEIALYAQLLKNQLPQVHISLLIESGCSCTASMCEENLRTALEPLIDAFYFDTMSKPIDVAKRIIGDKDESPADVVINLEAIKNCESVAALTVRQGGLICHTNIANNYSQALLLVESLGKKDVTNYALDSVYDNTYRIALELVAAAEPIFKKLDVYFEQSRGKRKINSRSDGESGVETVKQIDGFIYMSPETGELVADALNVAKYDCNVIIQGETGVGKERIFDLIHQNSPRRSKPCIKINCATIQESLAESEFFGYEKGAFTGASGSGKEGYFEMANNGTLFLDEIGSLPLSMQSKLLRVLQENTFYRVGGTAAVHVNVRVICANNVPLKKLVGEGKFREDLFYRLNICRIEIPPLRKRKEDIYCLAEHFIKHYSQKYGIEKEFSISAYRLLEGYHWPGNVRELENTVHRLYIAERGVIIDADSVDSLLNENVYDESVIDIKREFRRDAPLDFNEIMDRQEKKLIAYALKKEGTTRKAAELLNLPQTTLARKKLKHNL